MIVLRSTAKLLKRLRQPAVLPAAPLASNPLGEWYADLEFFGREPFVLLLNAATGAALVLPARAADLRVLHQLAEDQLRKLFVHFGFDLNHPLVEAELLAWQVPLCHANTADRSLLGTLNRYRLEAWHHFAANERSLPEVAARFWDGLFRHPTLAAPGKRYDTNAWRRPRDLLHARLTLPVPLMPATHVRH